MANFDYLLQYKEFSAFSGLANEAEKQYNKSTMFCGISARKCVEQAVNWMYSVDDDLYMPYDDSLQVLISDKNFVKIVPGFLMPKSTIELFFSFVNEVLFFAVFELVLFILLL